jgi:hypothetical protein
VIIGIDEWYPVYMIEERDKPEDGWNKEDYFEISNELIERYHKAHAAFNKVQDELAKVYNVQDR